MPSRQSSRAPAGNGLGNSHIDKLDFDAHRKLPSTNNTSRSSSLRGLLQDDESLLSNVVDGIIQRDRRKMARQVTKYLSFGSAILCW
jgi:hypothetical protein